MKKLTGLMTAEEFGRLPDNGMIQELVRGEVIEMPLPQPKHGQTCAIVGCALYNHVRQHSLGKTFINDTGYILHRDPDTVRGPDCSFVRKERLPKPLPDGYLEFGPDLAVEALSPDDRPRAVREKIEDYDSGGVRMVWIVDARRRTVTVHRPGAPDRVLAERDVLDGEEVVPGFRLEISRIFED